MFNTTTNTTRVRQDGGLRGGEAEDDQGHQVFEAGQQCVREHTEAGRASGRRHLHRGQQRRRQGGCGLKNVFVRDSVCKF